MVLRGRARKEQPAPVEGVFTSPGARGLGGTSSPTRVRRLPRQHLVWCLGQWSKASQAATNPESSLGAHQPRRDRRGPGPGASSRGPCFTTLPREPRQRPRSPLITVRLPCLLVSDHGPGHHPPLRLFETASEAHPRSPGYEADYRRLAPHPPPLHRHDVLVKLAHLQRAPFPDPPLHTHSKSRTGSNLVFVGCIWCRGTCAAREGGVGGVRET